MYYLTQNLDFSDFLCCNFCFTKFVLNMYQSNSLYVHWNFSCLLNFALKDLITLSEQGMKIICNYKFFVFVF